MTTMLEKMAAAIAAEEARQLQANYPRNEVSGMAVARAALLAIREPDHSMLMAGQATGDQYDGCDPEDSWQAMIDAILAEEPEKAA